MLIRGWASLILVNTFPVKQTEENVLHSCLSSWYQVMYFGEVLLQKILADFHKLEKYFWIQFPAAWVSVIL